jgi:hypothetical protein
MKLTIFIINVILSIISVILIVYIFFFIDRDQSAKDCHITPIYTGKHFTPITTCEEQEDSE